MPGKKHNPEEIIAAFDVFPFLANLPGITAHTVVDQHVACGPAQLARAFEDRILHILEHVRWKGHGIQNAAERIYAVKHRSAL